MQINEFTLISTDLLCKHGFGDGDLLGDCVFDNYYVYDGKKENFLIERELFDYINDNEERLLIDIVKDFLIPNIEKNHKIKIAIIDSHNPIRITEIDGIADFDEKYPIEPKGVVILGNDLLSYLRNKMKKGRE